MGFDPLALSFESMGEKEADIEEYSLLASVRLDA